MKVAIFTDTFFPGVDGVVRSIQNQVSQLTHIQFLIVCPSYNLTQEIYNQKNVELLRINSFPVPNYKQCQIAAYMRKTCKQKIEEFQPDVVHVQSFGTLSLLGFLLAKKMKIPCVGTYHTLVAEFTKYLSPTTIFGLDALLRKFAVRLTKQKLAKQKRTPLKEIIWRASISLYNYSDVIIVPSKTIKRELEMRNAKKKVLAISNGIDLKEFKPLKRTCKQTFIHVGRMSFEKRVDIVIQAFSHIVKELPKAKLFILGDGPAKKDLEMQAKKLGIQKSIIFVGFVKHSQLSKYLKKANVFMTASPMETQGIVMLEAMATGLPVVGVDRYAIPDLVSHGINGYIAKKDYDNEMAKYAISIVSDPIKEKRLSVNAIKTVQKHEISYCIKQLEKVYKSVSQKKKKHDNV